LQVGIDASRLPLPPRRIDSLFEGEWIVSTPTEVKAPSAIRDTMAVSSDISACHLAVGLLAMFVLYELVRGLPRFLSHTGAVQVLARDIGALVVPMLLGWASAKIHEVLVRRRRRARTALRRDTLIAASY